MCESHCNPAALVHILAAHESFTSSGVTWKLINFALPNDVVIAQSVASRPLTTAMRRMLNVDHYSGIVIEIDSTNGINAAAEQTRSLLHSLHHIQQNQPDDFQVQNQKTLLDTQMAAASRLDFFSAMDRCQCTDGL
jgi:hypothetical protein